MPKLLMLRGISGSGKSTKAKELTQTHNMYRVNRDDLRLMMYAGKWSSDKEKAVVAAERSIVEGLLRSNKNVVVDDTNLLVSHKNMWKQIAENCSKNDIEVKFEVMEIRTPLADCIVRDKIREVSVTEAIIQRQAIKSGMYNVSTEPGSVIFCDLDGTICDGTHREHLLDDKSNKNRWKDYFSLCGKDKPIEFVIKWLHELKKAGKTIILVSGRAADLTLEQTKLWLELNEVPYDRLLMRLGGDGRPDTEVKLDILKEFLLHHPKEAIDFVIDDRPSVIRMWKENGLKVYPVAGGCEEF